MAEYNIDEYHVEGEDSQYNLKISLVDNKINLQLTEISENNPGRNYEGEFTLEELRQINRVFLLTNTIYDAQDEFKKAIERQKIALSENEAYVNIMFQMVLGTDNSPFVIALPRNESVRIMKLEQDTDLLKLERDNLFDKLEIIKRNTNEVLQSTRELEEDYNNLKNTTIKIENNMNNATPAKPMSPTSISDMKGSYAINNQNSQNLSDSKNLNQQSQNSNISQKLRNSRTMMEPEHKVLKYPPKKAMVKRFKCGLISNVITTPEDLSNVTQRIQGYLNSKIHYNLIFFAKVDGDKASTFHKKCDKAQKSLVLIKDNNGNRFGGFTMRDWGGNCIQKKDDKAFIFSIDKKKIYGVLPDQVAIGCYPNFGPIFFGCQIRVYDNFFSKGGSTYLKGLNYETEEDYELTNGNQAYGIKELEVYEVEESQ